MVENGPSITPSCCKTLNHDPVPVLIPFGAMSYGHFRISIFKAGTDLFFYEPIVVLDPKSIKTKQVSLLTGGPRLEVSFKIEMWNSNLEYEINKYLQREVEPFKRFRLQVMPYEQVRLLKTSGDRGKIAFELPCIPKSYMQLHHSLEFKVWCDSTLEKSFLDDLGHQLANHLALELRKPAAQPTNSEERGSAIGGGYWKLFDINILS